MKKITMIWMSDNYNNNNNDNLREWKNWTEVRGTPSKDWKKWTDIPLSGRMPRLPFGDIQGPLNEFDERCSWPWEPIALAQNGANTGMFHCSFCGGMVMIGLPHFDFDNLDLSSVNPSNAEE